MRFRNRVDILLKEVVLIERNCNCSQHVELVSIDPSAETFVQAGSPFDLPSGESDGIHLLVGDDENSRFRTVEVGLNRRE
jgi:hypothetical protein